jgi:hypothetical protein
VRATRLALCALLLLAACSKKPAPDSHANVRVELLAYLAQQHPVWNVSERDSTLLIDMGGGVATRIELPEVYRLTDGLTNAGAREAVYAKFAAIIADQVKDQRVTLEKDGARLLPRLVPDAFFATLPADTVLPHRAVGETGLAMVVVLDNPQSVAYVTDRQLAQLGLKEDALFARALDNLRPKFDPAIVQGVLKDKQVVAIKMGDSFEAARLLLVPEALEDGQQIAAIVPDKDVLMLAPVPVDGNWASLQGLARNASGQVLLDRPLLVTKAGFELK